MDSIVDPPPDSNTDPRPLSWDDLCTPPTYTDLLGEVRPEMRKIWLAGLPAVVVPTRMHRPGWYIRSENDPDLSRYWLLRSEAAFEFVRQLCAVGAVLAR